MTTKERVHRLCVRLAEQAIRAADYSQREMSRKECVAAAFEPTVERLVEALERIASYAKWDFDHSAHPEGCVCVTCVARIALAELERE